MDFHKRSAVNFSDVHFDSSWPFEYTASMLAMHQFSRLCHPLHLRICPGAISHQQLARQDILQCTASLNPSERLNWPHCRHHCFCESHRAYHDLVGLSAGDAEVLQVQPMWVVPLQKTLMALKLVPSISKVPRNLTSPRIARQALA